MPASQPASLPFTEIDRALARAVISRFLARSLGPPDTVAAGPSTLGAGHEALKLAARVLGGPTDTALVPAVERLIAGGEPKLVAELHARLFGHTLRGLVCPYESEFGPRALLQQAHELSDLAGFYAAFGLKPSGHLRERPDHVVCEFEFLEILSKKEAFALETADGEMVEVTRAAIEKLLREHLGRFGRAFAASLQTADSDGHYGRLGALCETFLINECREFEVPMGPPTLELCSTEEEAVPMACATADDLVQIGAPIDPER